MSPPVNRADLIRLIDAAIEGWASGALKAASPAEAVIDAVNRDGLVVTPGEPSAEMADAAAEALMPYKMFGSGPYASLQVAIACVGFSAMLEAGRVDR